MSDFFSSDFGTISLWVMAAIILIPLALAAIVVALGAVFWIVIKVVWALATAAAFILVISGIAYLTLYFTDNLSLIQNFTL
jgi:hypothetical protein